jgi:site-specific DNA-methyltransferase (adenine-specific)
MNARPRPTTCAKPTHDNSPAVAGTNGLRPTATGVSVKATRRMCPPVTNNRKGYATCLPCPKRRRGAGQRRPAAPVLKQESKATHDPKLCSPIPAYPLDTMNKADGLDLLRGTPDEYTKLVIFDPQYRHVMDHLKFGNEGERQKQRAKLPQQSNLEISQFGAEIVRVLKPGGYVMLWCDKFILCEGIAPEFFQDQLKLVDLVTWNKCKMGMGKRTRRVAEYAIFFQKAPHVIRTKKLVTWRTQPVIRDVWDEKIGSKDKIHGHQKPFGLQKAVIEATTDPGDVVIDPVAGSFSVMHAAHACGRRFLGGDILGPPQKAYTLPKVESPSIDPSIFNGRTRKVILSSITADSNERHIAKRALRQPGAGS